jgi:type II secretory pathway pseudopilin PulG
MRQRQNQTNVSFSDGEFHRDSSILRLSHFSLIEMMSVIAILMILASLLQPSLKGMLSKAEGIKCLKNLRTLYVDFDAYIGDQGDLFPPTAKFYDSGFVNFWSDYLYDGLQDNTHAPVLTDVFLKRTEINQLVCSAVTLGERPPVSEDYEISNEKFNGYRAYGSYGMNPNLQCDVDENGEVRRLPNGQGGYVTKGRFRYLHDQRNTDGVLFAGGMSQGIIGSGLLQSGRYGIYPERHDMNLEYMFIAGHARLGQDFYYETIYTNPWKLDND